MGFDDVRELRIGRSDRGVYASCDALSMTFSVVSPVGANHVEDILRLFSRERWTKDRSRSDIEQIVAGSTTTVGLVVSGKLVAFARILSDQCYLAMVLDVIVDHSCRGQGLGDRLLEVVLDLPDVASANSVELVCQPDLFAFYKRHGFTANVGQSTLMRRTSDPALGS